MADKGCPYCTLQSSKTLTIKAGVWGCLCSPWPEDHDTYYLAKRYERSPYKITSKQRDELILRFAAEQSPRWTTLEINALRPGYIASIIQDEQRKGRNAPIAHPAFEDETIRGSKWLRFVYYIARIIMRTRQGIGEELAFEVERWPIEGSQPATLIQVQDCIKARRECSTEAGQGVLQVLSRVARELGLTPPALPSMKVALHRQGWWKATGGK